MKIAFVLAATLLLAGCPLDNSRLVGETKQFCADSTTREYLAERANCDGPVPEGATPELIEADAKIKRLCSGVRRLCEKANNAVNYPALKALIDSEAANAARNDAEVMAWLLEDATQQVRATRNTLIAWAAGGIQRRLEAARDNIAESEAKRDLAAAAIKVLDGPDGMDVGDPTAQAHLNAMVSESLITQAEKDGLEAMVTSTVPRYVASGVTWNRATREDRRIVDVQRARA